MLNTDTSFSRIFKVSNLPSELLQKNVNIQAPLSIQERNLRRLFPRLPFTRGVADGAPAQSGGRACRACGLDLWDRGKIDNVC